MSAVPCLHARSTMVPSVPGIRHPNDVVQYGDQWMATRKVPGPGTRTVMRAGSRRVTWGDPGPLTIDSGSGTS